MPSCRRARCWRPQSSTKCCARWTRARARTLAELRPTLDAVAGLSRDAAPVFHDLRPGGRVFAPALRDTATLAPRVQSVFADVDRLAAAAQTGLPAATDTVQATKPIFDIL